MEESKYLKFKLNNLNRILDYNYFLEAENIDYFININCYYYYYNNTLKYYNIVFQNNPKNILCLKNCAHIYEIQEKYSDALEILDKILEINWNDSLILCYYGKILNYLNRYNDSISYFIKAYKIDSENIHILIKKTITYYEFQKYDKAFLDLNKCIQLDSSNNLTYYALGNNTDYKIELENCNLFDLNDNFAKVLLNHLEYLLLYVNDYKDHLFIYSLQEDLYLQLYFLKYLQ